MCNEYFVGSFLDDIVPSIDAVAGRRFVESV